MTVRIVQVIYSDENLKGDGTKENIFRRLPSLHTLDGSLICRFDCGPVSQASPYEQFVDDVALRSLERQKP